MRAVRRLPSAGAAPATVRPTEAAPRVALPSRTAPARRFGVSPRPGVLAPPAHAILAVNADRCTTGRPASRRRGRSRPVRGRRCRSSGRLTAAARSPRAQQPPNVSEASARSAGIRTAPASASPLHQLPHPRRPRTHRPTPRTLARRRLPRTPRRTRPQLTDVNIRADVERAHRRYPGLFFLVRSRCRRRTPTPVPKPSSRRSQTHGGQGRSDGSTARSSGAT